MGTDWHLFDHEEMLDRISQPLSGGWREILLMVDGVHCAGCVRGVERALGPDVRDVQVNTLARTVSLRFMPLLLPLSQLLQRLHDAGYQPRVLAAAEESLQQRQQRRAELARLGVSVLCAMQVMMLAWPEYFDAGELDPGIRQLLRWTQVLLSLPAVFYSGWPFFASAWKQLRHRSLGMDVPVAASLLIAFGVSLLRTLQGEGALYFDAATMFVMLLSGGRYLEGRTRVIASERLRALAGRRPLSAQRLRDGQMETISVAAVKPGDVLRVASGEAAPADGHLLSAVAELDESLLTGESHPVSRGRGDRVMAGSLNAGAQSIDFTVAAVGGATRLASITRLLDQAHAQKPPVQQITDRIAAVFTLGVLILAAMAGLWWYAANDPERALNALLAVLLVSCPCALSLAVPAVHAAASSRLAQAGILLARPGVLARLPQVTHVLFDKTGTLTPSTFSVEVVQALGSRSADECVAIAAALERGLPHPLARTIAAMDQSLNSEQVQQQEGGISGMVRGQRYWLGAPDKAVFKAGHEWLAQDIGTLTTIVLLCQGVPLALFSFSSRLREDAASTVRALSRQSLHATLLTGDAAEPARHVATQCGISQLSWRQSPEHKLNFLKRLRQHGSVVMAVGDGINDAPLLAAADVGVAMPEGAALAQARADVILVNERLSGLPQLLTVSRLAVKRVRQNLLWALGYNLLMLPLAFSGRLPPWLAALGMSLSSLLVMLNALRMTPPTDETDSDSAPAADARVMP